MDSAREQQRLLLIYFRNEATPAADDTFERGVLSHAKVQPLLDAFVLLRLPLDAKVEEQGKPITLLKHRAFAELRAKPGLAIIDWASVGAGHYGKVVSLYPFRKDRPLDLRGFTVLAELPPGTLTQRTLLLAIRTHADRPQSTSGELHPLLAAESASHAAHQARITLQGHHNWDERFHRINARLANGMVAQEVCAESWPGQGLVEAAEDCVHSWRQSAGHWSAVSARQPIFGYDMQRGRNGVWYATGIFARRP